MYFKSNPYRYYMLYDKYSLNNISPIDKIYTLKDNQKERLLSEYHHYINSYIK